MVAGSEINVVQTYRCRCGQTGSWGSMSPGACRGCPKCGTRLELHPKVEGAEGQVWVPPPERFRTPELHEWQTRYNEVTGVPREECRSCLKVKERG